MALRLSGVRTDSASLAATRGTRASSPRVLSGSARRVCLVPRTAVIPSKKRERKPVECMDRVVRPPDGLGRGRDAAHPPCNGRQQRLAFRPGDIHADTGMNADTKRQMAACASADIEAFGICPFVGIEVQSAAEFAKPN